MNRLRRAVLLNLGLWIGGLAQAKPAAPALLLAQEAPADMAPQGWLVSEKLDGVRALWDGEVLRLRGGGAVAAPDWFLRQLPRHALDGELWLGRGRFEEVSGLVRRSKPDDAAWRAVRYMVFELPGGEGTFLQRVRRLHSLHEPLLGGVWQPVAQDTLATSAALMARLQAVVAAGGEGLMLHKADALYLTGRSSSLLKLKPQQDAEAVVLRHLGGKGRLQGQVGALWVRNEAGIEFAVGSGLDDAMRRNPPAPGSRITYRHRGHTGLGVPRFATYLRLAS